MELRGLGKTTPPILCIVGSKDSGKTGLTVALAAELNRRGHRVMTVKHGHGFELDRPGKDSWRHRHEGGAIRTVLAGPRDFGVVGGWPEGEMSLTELVDRFLWDADVVLAEGFKNGPEARIEVVREALPGGMRPEAGGPELGPTLAVVAGVPPPDLPIPVLRAGEPDLASSLADLVEVELLGKGKGR